MSSNLESEDISPLTDQVHQLSIDGKSDNNDNTSNCELGREVESADVSQRSTGATILCDAGYGLPREKKPRNERINAICSQLSNFVQWQIESSSRNETPHNGFRPIRRSMASIRIVGCPDEATRLVLKKRLLDVLKLQDLPAHVSISCMPLEEAATLQRSPISKNDDEQQEIEGYDENCGKKSKGCDDDNNERTEYIYLSPDAEMEVDPSDFPPKNVVVGLIIDRRIQPDRSKQRAKNVNIVAKRWPLGSCFANIDPNEPLNVDCILEGMQRWWWNCDELLLDGTDETDNPDKNNEEKNSSSHTHHQLLLRESFIRAASRSLESHASRHPSRSLHKVVTSNPLM